MVFERATSHMEKITPLLEARLELSGQNRWWNGIGRGDVSKRGGSVVNKANIVDGSGQFTTWIFFNGNQERWKSECRKCWST